jgi:hypothetical protein
MNGTAPHQEFEDRRDRLIQEIESAFQKVQRLDGITLHEAIVLDNCGSPQAQRLARALDPEDRWQDVPDAEIRSCNSALSFLDIQGFRFYLPAFMRTGLRHFEDEFSGVRNTCEVHLTHDHPKSLRQSNAADIAAQYRFTAAQIRAIAHFLRLVADFDPYHEGAVFVEAVEKWERLADGAESPSTRDKPDD